MVCRMKDAERKGRKSGKASYLFAGFAVWAFLVVTLPAQQQALTPQSDTAAVERGQKLLVDQCGFCHGANARGGSSGPDLTRSTLHSTDDAARQRRALLAAVRTD